MDLRTAFRCRTLVQQDATITTEEVIVHLAAIVWQEGTAAAQGLRHAPLALQEKISLTLVKLHVTIAQQEGTAAAQGLRHAPLALQENISLTLVKLHVTIAQQERTAAAQDLRHAPLALQEKISLTLVKLHVMIAQQESTSPTLAELHVTIAQQESTSLTRAKLRVITARLGKRVTQELRLATRQCTLALLDATITTKEVLVHLAAIVRKESTAAIQGLCHAAIAPRESTAVQNLPHARPA